MENKATSKPLPVMLVSHARIILTVIYAASIVAAFNQFKIPPLMPVLMKAYQIDLTQAGLLMSVIAIIGLVLALPTEMILQRLGSKARYGFRLKSRGLQSAYWDL